MAATLADLETKTVGKGLGNVQDQALVDTVSDTLTSVEVKALVKTENEVLQKRRLTQTLTN